MATALPPSPVPIAPAVQHPLDRLRGVIRRYVTLEGLAVFGVYVALWFWVGLLLDFGVFYLFGVDWVQELPRGFRGTLLALLLGGLAAVILLKVVRRLMVEFRPGALAMVLERRFPQQLGDRLITAIELADLDEAERQGYSRSMIEQTVRDAAERVGRVPVQDVFNWQRLRRLWAWVVMLSIGLLVAVGFAYTATYQAHPLNDFAIRFKDVAAIWFERNVLLRDTIWPRHAHLELLDFPASGDLRVGRDAPSPRLRVRAIKWLVADSAAFEGWRAMTWDDLTPELAGGPVPKLPTELLDPLMGGATADPVVPTSPTESGNNPQSAWTLDRVNLLLGQSEVRQRLNGVMPVGEYETLLALFEDRLPAKAAEPGMGRRFRLLDVPDRVEVSYWGEKTSSEMPLARGNDQEYAGLISDLKESVRFRVRARDYATRTRTITLVPPPMLTQLVRDEYRPAYLFHRPPLDGGPAALKGLKQLVPEQGVSLAGPASQFTVPFGTDVDLSGQVDKELTGAVLRPRSRKGDAAGAPVVLKLTDDRLGFRHRFDALMVEQDFDLEFTDTDNVVSRRHVRIEPVKDAVPRVNLMIEGIRKTPSGYMVTPVAMIPFGGSVADNAGLDKIEYNLTLQRLESAGVAGAQSSLAAGLVAQFAPAMPAGLLAGSGAIGEISRLIVANTAEARPFNFPLKSFEEIVRERTVRDVLQEELVRRLGRAPSGESPLVTQFEVKPQYEFLDLRDRLPDLKVKEESQIQPRYRMRLTVTATDNNVETGPGVGPNKEPPFTLLVVSEPELLVEIGKEEQNLHFKLEDTVTRLKDAKLKLEKLTEQLPALPANELPPMALRAQEINEATGRARDVTQEVLTEYSRLLKEMELNRVMPKLVEKVKGEIIFPLEGALRQEFVRAEEAEETYRKQLEAGRKPDDAATQLVQRRLDELIDRLTRVMDAMGEVGNINQLITKLREIEKQEQAIGDIFKKMRDEKQRRILDGIGG